MIDCLDGLGHHVVVGGHDDDGQVGHLGTTGTHGRERLVTRGIEERDVASVVQLDIVCADMLRDTSGLAGNHVGLADIVQQRRLTVVHVAHDGHDGRTALQFLLLVLNMLYGLGHVCGYEFGLESELLGHDVDGLGIQALVDRHHHAEVHTCGYDFVDGDVHQAGQVVGGNELRDLKHLAFGCLALGVGQLAVVHLLATLLAELHALVCLLGGEARQGLLYLLLNVLVADLLLGGSVRIAAVAAATSASATLLTGHTRLVAATLALVLALVGAESRLRRGLLHIDLLLADALALTLGAALFLGTCGRVDGRQVYLAHHLQAGCRRCGTGRTERFCALRSLGFGSRLFFGRSLGSGRLGHGRFLFPDGSGLRFGLGSLGFLFFFFHFRLGVGNRLGLLHGTLRLGLRLRLRGFLHFRLGRRGSLRRLRGLRLGSLGSLGRLYGLLLGLGFGFRLGVAS